MCADLSSTYTSRALSRHVKMTKQCTVQGGACGLCVPCPSSCLEWTKREEIPSMRELGNSHNLNAITRAGVTRVVNSTAPYNTDSLWALIMLVCKMYILKETTAHSLSITINPERNGFYLSGIQIRVHPHLPRLTHYRCRHWYAT